MIFGKRLLCITIISTLSFFSMNAESLAEAISLEKARNELVKGLYDIGAIKLGEYILKSGQITPIYMDLRGIISHPDIMNNAADFIASILKNEMNSSHYYICGVPFGVLGVTAAVASRHNIPMIMQRKEVKSHGTRKMVEGDFEIGDECVVIEDVITTGMSILETIAILNKEGLQVKKVIIMVDREQGGKQNLEAQGYEVYSMFKISELVEMMYVTDIIGTPKYEEVMTWLRNNRK